MTVYTLPITNIAIPFILVFVLNGMKGIKETLPAILVSGLTYAVTQVLITIFMGPELADIIPSLLAMAALAIFCNKWQPKNIFRLSDDQVETVHHPIKEIISAWSPFIFLTGLVLLWSLPAFKALFAEGGILQKSILTFQMPGTFNETLQKV